MSSEEVKTENSSQEVKTYSQEQFEGLLVDKQAERSVITTRFIFI